MSEGQGSGYPVPGEHHESRLDQSRRGLRFAPPFRRRPIHLTLRADPTGRGIDHDRCRNPLGSRGSSPYAVVKVQPLRGLRDRPALGSFPVAGGAVLFPDCQSSSRLLASPSRGAMAREGRRGQARDAGGTVRGAEPSAWSHARRRLRRCVDVTVSSRGWLLSGLIPLGSGGRRRLAVARRSSDPKGVWLAADFGGRASPLPPSPLIGDMGAWDSVAPLISRSDLWTLWVQVLCT